MSINPNHSYFDGHYQEIWKQVIPEQLTDKEIGHLVDQYGLNTSTQVLDLMCGHGRHTLALAAKGIPVTAVDNLSSYIQQIEQVATSHSLPISTFCQNLLEWNPVAGHDWALCMGNSLNFFSPVELPVLLRKVADSLVPGGYFWINSWSIAEIALPRTQNKESHSSEVGPYQHTNHFELKNDPLRIEIQSIIKDELGDEEEKLAIDYLYSIEELRHYLAAAGLQLIKAESVPGKKLFSEGDPRVYILSQKI
jgi:SAM-dependent methyltransferase